MAMFRGRTKRRKSEVRAITHLFHGVEVLPGPGACESVKALAGQRMLSEEAPLLPLADCTNSLACSCHYRHFKDRRTEVRRESDDGLPPRMVEADRRDRAGRRVTDG